MNIPLAHHQVRLTLDLHLELVLGVEEHAIGNLHVPHTTAYTQYITPRESTCHLGGSGNDDASAATPLAFLRGQPNKHPIVQHLNF